MIGGFKHSFAILTCIVEAYPPPVNYWERHDGRLVQQLNFGRSKGKVGWANFKLFTINKCINNITDYVYSYIYCALLKLFLVSNRRT